MKTIQVRDQVHLPLRRCLELVLSGVRYRLFRAAITVTIIALAGAFLMVMLTEGFSARQVAADIAERTAPRETFRSWVSRISIPMTELQLAEELAAASPGQPRWGELVAWGELSDEDLRRLVELARRHRKYLAYFRSLAEGQRRILVGPVGDDGLFAELTHPTRFATFQEGLKTSSRQLPTTVEEFQKFLTDGQDTSPVRQKILSANAAAVAQVQRTFLTGGQTPQSLLTKADEALVRALAALGFRMPADILPQLREQAALSVDSKTLLALYVGPAAIQTGVVDVGTEGEGENEEPEGAKAPARPHKGVVLVKTLLAARLGVNITKVNDQMLYEHLSSGSGAQWFVGVTACDTKGGLDARRVRQVAEFMTDQSRLETIKNNVGQVAASEGFLGFNNRTLSLIVVSFMVCIVGIANAMLMSVTERFREIATMKCLGATDGFIMINFIMESIMLGIAGGAIGMVLGFILGQLRAWGSYGLMALTSLPVLAVLAAAAVALVVSIIISALAAVYPAWVAARLAPMEAMRIE
ncbi:MAG: FtsX-like permease family protein [Phycisphaerae bacterium]|nr:FtsX-like permease family protein [Phycisphaerae bacterium]